jgi:hypothetical protein
MITARSLVYRDLIVFTLISLLQINNPCPGYSTMLGIRDEPTIGLLIDLHDFLLCTIPPISTDTDNRLAHWDKHIE